mgnify:CR=1 FL=1
MAGVETVGPASMGMMTKGVCRAMLKFGNAKLKGKNAIRHSFGGNGSGSTVRRESQWGRSSLTDRQISEDSTASFPLFSLDTDFADVAYASVPLLSAADRFVTTPIGETPPDIYQEFQESVGNRSKRRNNPERVKFDNTSTYSITFKGRNIDFCEWSTCGFYMIKSASLNSFLGASSGLRLVAYCLDQPTGRSSTPTTTNKPLPDSLPAPGSVSVSVTRDRESCSLEMLAAQTLSKMVYVMEVSVTASTSQIMISNDEEEEEEEEDEESDSNSDTDEVPVLQAGKASLC